ncbi:MAG: energy transducer TonB [Williamsia sp.]|nr:energy transducer TonB [Williamsia sp.]
MEANKILQADLLDILFEGRNKEYGAYELRKTYNKRLVVALTSMMALLGVLSVGYVVANKAPASIVTEFEMPDPRLVKIPDAPVVTPPPPTVLKPQLPRVATIQFTPPRIVRDEDVTKADMPEITEIEDVRIDKITQDGVKDDVVAPPVEDRDRGILEAPKKVEEDLEKTFIIVEIESKYPGGSSAWMRYLNKTFRYPASAQEIGIQGTVVVQFIVDKEGNVSNVEAIDGPPTGGLREEAVRVIQKSGKWEPAVQNGRKVKSYKKQPITFRLEAE